MTDTSKLIPHTSGKHLQEMILEVIRTYPDLHGRPVSNTDLDLMFLADQKATSAALAAIVKKQRYVHRGLRDIGESRRWLCYWFDQSNVNILFGLDKIEGVETALKRAAKALSKPAVSAKPGTKRGIPKGTHVGPANYPTTGNAPWVTPEKPELRLVHSETTSLVVSDEMIKTAIRTLRNAKAQRGDGITISVDQDPSVLFKVTLRDITRTVVETVTEQELEA